MFSYELNREEKSEKWGVGSVGYGTFGLAGLKLAKIETFPIYNEKIRPIPSVTPGEPPSKEKTLEDDLLEDDKKENEIPEVDEE